MPDLTSKITGFGAPRVTVSVEWWGVEGDNPEERLLLSDSIVVQGDLSEEGVNRAIANRRLEVEQEIYRPNVTAPFTIAELEGLVGTETVHSS